VRADDAKRRTDRVISGCAGEIHDWREEIKKKSFNFALRWKFELVCTHFFAGRFVQTFHQGGKEKILPFCDVTLTRLS
jgi:hypothetical protein